MQAAAPLRTALKEATEEAQASEAGTHASSGEPSSAEAPMLLLSQAEKQQVSPRSGEGIGLTIVKRLCELLGASVELSTAKGAGTTIQINFPLHYENGCKA